MRRGKGKVDEFDDWHCDGQFKGGGLLKRSSWMTRKRNSLQAEGFRYVPNLNLMTIDWDNSNTGVGVGEVGSHRNSV